VVLFDQVSPPHFSFTIKIDTRSTKLQLLQVAYTSCIQITTLEFITMQPSLL